VRADARPRAIKSQGRTVKPATSASGCAEPVARRIAHAAVHTANRRPAPRSHAAVDVLPSSVATTARLQSHGIQVFDLNDIESLPVYVDGADEIDHSGAMIKGGGGALTREKIVAAASERFVCIVDDSKLVDVLGRFPLPVEVIPMARSYVARQIVKIGGEPIFRQGFTTDNGNVILDVRNLNILNPVELEGELDHVAGLVENGVFARRPADVLLVGTDSGVVKIE